MMMKIMTRRVPLLVLMCALALSSVARAGEEPPAECEDFCQGAEKCMDCSDPDHQFFIELDHCKCGAAWLSRKDDFELTLEAYKTMIGWVKLEAYYQQERGVYHQQACLTDCPGAEQKYDEIDRFLGSIPNLEAKVKDCSDPSKYLVSEYEEIASASWYCDKDGCYKFLNEYLRTKISSQKDSDGNVWKSYTDILTRGLKNYGKFKNGVDLYRGLSLPLSKLSFGCLPGSDLEKGSIIENNEFVSTSTRPEAIKKFLHGKGQRQSGTQIVISDGQGYSPPTKTVTCLGEAEVILLPGSRWEVKDIKTNEWVINEVQRYSPYDELEVKDGRLVMKSEGAGIKVGDVIKSIKDTPESVDLSAEELHTLLKSKTYNVKVNVSCTYRFDTLIVEMIKPDVVIVDDSNILEQSKLREYNLEPTFAPSRQRFGIRSRSQRLAPIREKAVSI